MARLGRILVLSVLWCAVVGPAWSQKIGEAPFLLSADQMTYDKKLGYVTAIGDVEISSEGRVLLADRVNYNQRDGVVTASGNLTLLEPNGEVIFAEHMRLSDDLTKGFIKSIRILLTDNSRFAANEARLHNENQLEMNRAVYSPCELCEDDPSRAPLWQLKAVKVVHYRNLHEVEYRHATLEVFGIPIAYTPYFRHVDPLTQRKSGFLAPKLGSSSELGSTVQIPYFWAIDRERDLTFSPIITSEQELVLVGEYRALTELGGYQGEVSLTYTDKRNDNNERLSEKEIRGHVDALGRFDIDQTWRWGFDLSRSTDDTYLSRYDFNGEDTLTSSLFAGGFWGRNFAAASVFAFQGLEVDDNPGTTPLVAPLLEYSASWNSERLPGRVQLDASAVSLYRRDGFDSRRLSLDGKLQIPYVDDLGSIYALTANLGVDFYHLSGFAVTGKVDGDSSDNGIESRLWPVLALDWRFPFVRREGTVRQVVEPVVQLIFAPYGGNPKEIPNEDSRSLEFDDTNLFSLNRFPGNDRVESGPRANVGLKASAHGISGGYSSITVGQVFRVRDDDTFAPRTGLDDHRSDYVMALTVAPSQFLDLNHRLRLDRNKFSLRRNEIYFSIGPEYLKLNTSYIALEREQTVDELVAREELYNTLRWKIDQRWIATAENRRDLSGDESQIHSRVGIQYLDECIGFGLTIQRKFTRDRDVEPSTSVKFRFLLRNLG